MAMLVGYLYVLVVERVKSWASNRFLGDFGSEGFVSGTVGCTLWIVGQDRPKPRAERKGGARLAMFGSYVSSNACAHQAILRWNDRVGDGSSVI